jgi:hypothetical protein
MIAKKIKNIYIKKYNDNCIVIKMQWQFKKIRPNLHAKRLKIIYTLNLKVEFEACLQ